MQHGSKGQGKLHPEFRDAVITVDQLLCHIRGHMKAAIPVENHVFGKQVAYSESCHDTTDFTDLQ